MRRIHPEDRERTEATVHRRRQRRRARLHDRIPHHPSQRRTVALDRGQGRDRARRARVAPCVWSARISTSPTARLAELALAKARSASASSPKAHPSCCGWETSNGKCLYLNRTLREFWGVARGGRRRLRLERVPAPRRRRSAVTPCSGKPCATTRPSPSKPATGASTASTACCARMRSPASGRSATFSA